MLFIVRVRLLRFNLSIFLAKIKRRSTLMLGSGSKLLWKAKIVNLQPDDGAITIGKKSIICGELLTFAHGGRIAVGNDCYIGEGTKIWSGCSVSIGNNVLIAHSVSIMDNLTHPIDFIERRKHYESIYSAGHPEHIDLGDRPIAIGDDAWIAAGSIILRGVSIGARSIISAGSVVRHDVPPDTIVAGNPAIEIRSLHSNAADIKVIRNPKQS
jgi:acetyltransferase-like isoleucine patch superfamily enzyme